MPFTGSQSPSPERYGGGENGSDVNLVQHVYRALAQARGSAYDQAWPPSSPVGVENMAMARAIALDGYGQNTRLANNMFPSTMTAAGNLGRWEKILGLAVLTTDPESVRRARVVGTFMRFGVGNANQQIADACSSVLGPAFVAMLFFNPSTATSIVNGVSNVTVTATGGGSYPVVPTVTGTPTGAYRMLVTIQAMGQYKWSLDGGATTVASGITLLASNPLGSTGMTLNVDPGDVPHSTDTIAWSSQPGIPWSSTICTVDVQASYQASQYKIVDGSPQGAPNAAWWALVGQVVSLLDSILPAWDNFNVFVAASDGTNTFLLDEPNLDLELLS